MSDLWKELRSRRRARATMRVWRSAEYQWRGEIDRLRDALRVIEIYSNDHENARQIARQALGEDK